MTFLRPVAVGDVVCCYARCVKRGNTSISINIEVWVKKVSSEPIGQRYKATEALFIYVAVDSGQTSSASSGLRIRQKSLFTEAFFIPSAPRRSGGKYSRQSATRFTRFIAPSAHRRFHFAFKHIRRLRRQDFYIIHAAIGVTSNFTRTAFNT
jgi:acyl-CoA hydrolase